MKLGGSVLTDKTARATLRPGVLQRLARELATAPRGLAVVHGAGSFGHVLAAHHGLVHGADGTPEQREGFAHTLADVRDLSLRVVRAFQDAGLPAVPFMPFDLAALRDGVLHRFDAAPVEAALARGLVPVLTGDGVLDDARGFGILSGDTVMARLAMTLKPAAALFVSDVDGVMDRDPADPAARLLPRVRAGTAVAHGAARGVDVTGGMSGKLAHAAEIAKLGIPVRVVNGLEPGRLAAAVRGEETIGTVIDP